jgi:acetyl/propionyl-CoA carboxylase alpha subunit
MTDLYLQNPMTTRDRRLSKASSAWVRSFSCEDVRPLIVCRGPIRKEALDTFAQMGISHAGMLVSEKDSIVYTHALAPELRTLETRQVHHLKDYTGATKEERLERIADIIRIAKTHGYTHIFAGYGFMAEDGEFVRALEQAGLVFMGPASSVQFAAGLKDEAKRTALSANVSVTPGVDDATRRVLLRKYSTHAALRDVVLRERLSVHPGKLSDDRPLHELADAILEASYSKRVDLYTIDELGDELATATSSLLAQRPGRRFRLKAIGGGGGKGQRIVQAIPADAPNPEEAARAVAAEVPRLVREILNEVKAAGVGDNKNVLLELNIEETRHNEIQLLGNGEWCIALGGRDCSLQMHEQKLLEISLTHEALVDAIAHAKIAGNSARVASLEMDLNSLARMESEAERFGLAVGLNSASTFECIVEGDHHYFMEVNTRIQVEHRVTELCYSLVFTNPDDPADTFEVTSLVEAMVLLARHGKRLPRPTRKLRETHSVEARLNATNRALDPHAGGIILSWSENKDFEIRDDQGICVKNPDTGAFMRYRVAGAYDSNIALLLTYGPSRESLYERLVDMLRRTRIRGSDLSTNLAFHVGLSQWFAARDVWAKPTTRFVVPYLTQVGLVAKKSHELDLGVLWQDCGLRHERRLKEVTNKPEAIAALRKSFGLKETLIKRPIERLLEEPHLLSAFLSRNIGNFEQHGENITWKKNPLEILADTYWLVGKEPRPNAPASNTIWNHDQAIIDRGLAFYRDVGEALGISEWSEIAARLSQPDTQGLAPDLASRWPEIRGAHVGFQCGLELLTVLVMVGLDAGFYDIVVRDDCTIDIPPRLFEKPLQEQMKKVLAPPPAMRSNEIVAVSGGMFYAQEAPDRPPFVTVGSHFKVGDPLYLIEVMKMFNRVLAPFSGTIEEVLVTGGEGTIVQKGQPLFRVTPDEALVFEDPAEVARRHKTVSLGYLARVMA